MSSISKVCFECGMPISAGIAVCIHCGAKVGTLFDETAIPVVAVQKNRWSRVAKQMDENQRIEKAQDRANTSVIMGLTSFFPLFGIIMGITAVIYAAMSARTLKEHNVEDGQGSATAGYVIGALGIIAQICLVVYVIRLVSGFKS